MTKSTSAERDAPSQDTGSPAGSIPYIDPPTIPAGMTVETYRHVREHRKPHRIRRLVAHPVARIDQLTSAHGRSSSPRRSARNKAASAP